MRLVTALGGAGKIQKPPKFLEMASALYLNRFLKRTKQFNKFTLNSLRLITDVPMLYFFR